MHPAGRGVEIDQIARQAHLAPLLARWHADEWSHLYESWGYREALAELKAMTVPDSVPTTWIAFDGPGRSDGDVLGSISLVDHDDLDGFEHLWPWLVSLYVRPDGRSRGVGRLLVDQVVAGAAALGIDEIHLFTAGQEAYYLALGWRTIARPIVSGHEAAVMVYDTRPRAPRRALATGWCGDPNFLGAYSYLRPGGTPADRDLLAEPVHPGLYLAGEATWSAHPGTMHGAYWSGERAARAAFDSGARSVVVVGAGLAGLAAGRLLAGAGCATALLEASSEPGGRARVDRSLGVTLHLGAAWLHGEAGNPIAEWAQRTGVPWRTSDWGQRITYRAGLGRLDPAREAQLRRLHETLGGRLAALASGSGEAGLAAGDRPLGPSVRALLDGPDTVDAADRAVLAAWFRSEYENLYAAPLDDLSLRYRAEPYHLPGQDQMLTGGLDTVVAALADGLDIRCGQRVTDIRRIGETWQVGTEAGEHMAADAVIVTVSVGVLRAGRLRFDPPLPHHVADALSRIGHGPVVKVFVTFDERFWAPARTLWTVADPPEPLEVWIDVSDLAGRPTLCAFAAGEAAGALESMSEHELCRRAQEILQRARVGEAGGVPVGQG